MKVYVSYVFDRENAKEHRFNHGYHCAERCAYTSIQEAMRDIESMYFRTYVSNGNARKTKAWFIRDTKGGLIAIGEVTIRKYGARNTGKKWDIVWNFF